MASANVLNELTAQLNSKDTLSSSGNDGKLTKPGTKGPKPIPSPKPVNCDKSKAEEITQNKPNASEVCQATEAGKKKQKSGFFSKVKRFVKRPSKKHEDSKTVVENKGLLDEKKRAKSTSDLDSAADGNHRLSVGSDALSGITSGSETQESDTKNAHASHGMVNFFGRKLKLRSSWKNKFKVTKKDETSSEPVSPVEKHRTKAQTKAQVDSKENIANISSIFADDSFFQVSLTESSQVTGQQLDQSVAVSDISVLAETIPEHRTSTSAAQDKIRIAPKGRRRPTRFNSQSAVVSTKDKSVSIVKQEAAIARDKAATASDKKMDGQSQPQVKDENTNEKSMQLNLNDSVIQESQDEVESNDTVIIHTPGENPSLGKEKLLLTNDDEFGSWEHLSKFKSNSSLEISNISLARSPSGSSKNSENSLSKEGKEGNVAQKSEKEIALVKSMVEQAENIALEKEKESAGVMNESKKETFSGSKTKESENSTNSSFSVQQERNISDEKEQASPNLEEINADGPKKVDEEIEIKTEEKICDKDTLQTVFDAIVSRTKSIEEELSRSDKKPESKKEVAFNLDKEPDAKKISLPSKNLSFDMDDLDDMRSTDLQSMQIQRSFSLSAAVKPVPAKGISKSTSIDSDVSTARKTSQDVDKSCLEPKASVPGWVAIAKAKHRRNTVDDESEEEENKSNECPSDLNEKGSDDQQPPTVKDKPTLEKKTGSSKIPKPAFKSQSFKETRSTPPVSKLPSRNAKSVKATSPVAICIVCDKPAFQHERCDIDGQIAHKNCAKCSMCSRTINVGTIRVVNNKLYCGIHVRSAVS